MKVFKLKESKKGTQTFEGFGHFTGKEKQHIITRFDGEWELWDWDGTDIGVEELNRYFRMSYDREPEIMRKAYIKE